MVKWPLLGNPQDTGHFKDSEKPCPVFLELSKPQPNFFFLLTYQYHAKLNSLEYFGEY